MTPTIGESTTQLLAQCIAKTRSRFDFWVEFIRAVQVRRMVEVGVYRGDFAAVILARCDCVTQYYMVDPWRHLDDWNKPANLDDAAFEGFFRLTRSKTDFAASRRTILRGKTTEVIDQIGDRELDLAYIDGDHSLRGIAIDLIRVYPKVRPGGFLGGDDFRPTLWQHQTSFEPTLVFPFAVYFAEAVGATIYALPNSQFCLQKMDCPHFSFVDLTGHYNELGLRSQLAPGKLLKLSLTERFPGLAHIFRKAKKLFT